MNFFKKHTHTHTHTLKFLKFLKSLKFLHMRLCLSRYFSQCSYCLRWREKYLTGKEGEKWLHKRLMGKLYLYTDQWPVPLRHKDLHTRGEMEAFLLHPWLWRQLKESYMHPSLQTSNSLYFGNWGIRTGEK